MPYITHEFFKVNSRTPRSQGVEQVAKVAHADDVHGLGRGPLPEFANPGLWQDNGFDAHF